MSMPRSVSKRILERCAQEKVAVVVSRNGIPSRVFGLDEYLKMKNLPRKVQPWKHKKKALETPDPLGAVEGRILEPLSRERIYEG